LKEASTRKPVKFEEAGRKSVLFGSNVFNDKAMKQYLTSDALKEYKALFSMELK
jgi:glutamine synthetase